ncbi:hypothetical protein KAFR_0I01720 [Kazachstania africana CBS 2517]|uniref:Biogenesis of lysosome-related organelles complex 1 subunit BLI1 n=1 Tax=Kazachstania africana (strain ATCC 22294 / BCRC 22015 / CBS 2517 / CECT 1963 / NBRC 1671 / NRRL Y-8276) TaxID=1071382 RepID=H2B003_KAZAF|nr:hypothetical protein KAFR_0I01720 [Kazachstania africana CBS 2517]CCF59953.1 hypothetical protein KAFR_0I01720 [Kazachstania africana CBS 2517]
MKLNQDINNYINELQTYIDTESVKTISLFNKKSQETEEWLNRLSSEFENLKDEEELTKLKELHESYEQNLDELESKIEYLEKLCDEIDEVYDELGVKTKVNDRRKSRIKE